MPDNGSSPSGRQHDWRTRPALAYGAALLLVLAATAARAALTPWLGHGFPFLTYFPAVFIAAWGLGLRPTLAVTVLAAVLADVLLMEPAGRLSLADPGSVIGLAVFLMVGVGAGLLGERQRRASVRNEEQSRENESLRQLAESATLQAEEAAAEAEEEAARAVELADNQQRLAGELAESRQRLELALDAGRMGTFDWDIPAGRVAWSPSLERMHGYEPGTFAGTAEAYFAEVHPDDRERVGALVQEVLEGRREHQMDYRIVRPDGSVLWVEGRGTLLRDAEGRPARLIGLCADISGRREAEAALREREARYRSLVQATAQVIWTADRHGAFKEPSATWQGYTGQTAAESIGGGHVAAIHPDDRTRVLASWADARAAEVSSEVEFRLRRADGAYRQVVARTVPVVDATGAVHEWIGSLSDVDDQRRAESAQRFLVDASAALGSSLDYEATLGTVARLAVPALADWCAVDLVQPDGTLRRVAITHVDPAQEAWAWELARRFPPPADSDDGAYAVLRSGRSMLVPTITPEMLDGDGRRDPEFTRLLRQLGLVSYVGVPLTAHGKVWGVLSLLMSESGRHYGEADLPLAEELGRRVGVAVDNAGRHHAAIESLNMLDAMLRASPVGQAFVDEALRYVRVSPALASLHGRPIDQHLGRPVREVLPDWAPALEPLYRQVLETSEPVLDRTISVPAPDGGRYELLVNCFPVRDASGQVRWIGVTKADVTEQRQAEAALRASEARLRRIVESPLIGIAFYDMDGRIYGANEALCQLLGYTADEIENGAVRWDQNFTPAEYGELDRRAAEEVVERGVSSPYAKELLRKDGSRVPVLAGGARLDDDGKTGVFYVLDLTERRRVEEQVQVAQRLEAVGRLAGGVAHEINNALQGVLGFNAFVLRHLEERHPARGDAEQVQRAGERAAKITQQLLAYGRRQVLKPVDLELVQLVRDFTPMLRQALGPDRELVLDLPDAEAVVHADRAQLEQVLLNLSLNARDAMAPGGRLSIGIERRPPAHGDGSAMPDGAGGSVEVIVADTGSGMDEATRARAFDPFFTTKPPGKGTGLGLAVVYGIVQQSGGQIWLDSEPGAGTRVRILLPSVARRADRPAPSRPAAADGGSETLLVVDDEPTVRAVAASILREAGYDVLEAADGQQALDVVQSRPPEVPVELILTDIVMPEMGGRALAEALARRRCEVPVVFMSGYTGDEAVDRGLLLPGAELLQKPFTPNGLLEFVRGRLDGRRRGVTVPGRASDG